MAELAPAAAIASNPAWESHLADTAGVPEATADDVLWADGVIFGTPTRFGNVSSQLKQFLDTLGGPWSRNELADKVYSGFTATSTAHGGQESTLLALSRRKRGHMSGHRRATRFRKCRRSSRHA